MAYLHTKIGIASKKNKKKTELSFQENSGKIVLAPLPGSLTSPYEKFRGVQRNIYMTATLFYHLFSFITRTFGQSPLSYGQIVLVLIKNKREMLLFFSAKEREIH